MKLWSLLFAFNGRLDRRRFWLVQLLLTLLGGVIAVWELLGSQFELDPSLSTAAAQSTDLLALLPTQLHMSAADWLLTVLLGWPFIATQAKRFHDTDRSGWWTLINLIPIAGPLWATIMTGFFRGTRGPNRYGPDPLAA